jgi:hypothetical protein
MYIYTYIYIYIHSKFLPWYGEECVSFQFNEYSDLFPLISNPGTHYFVGLSVSVLFFFFNNDSLHFIISSREETEAVWPSSHKPIASHFKVWDVFHNELNQKSI